VKIFSRPPSNQKKSDNFQLVESHRPYLEAGNYVASAFHDLNTGQGGENFKAKPLKLYVFGDRFSLPESSVKSVFPPNGIRGTFDNVLPQVLLNRSSLPWERMPLHMGEDDLISPSWLALLVFSEEEAAKVHCHTVCVDGDEKIPHLADGKADFGAGMRPEPGQHDSDQVQVIDLPLGLLKSILPRYDDLPCLAHVRRISEGNAGDGLSIRPAEGRDDATEPGTGPAPAIGDEVAVVVANRLPPKNSQCVVHLVSLEERYRHADLSSEDTAHRTPIEIKSQKLADWLGQAHEKREKVQSLGVDLSLVSGPMARLWVVDDRDHPRKNDAVIVENGDLLNRDETDDYCDELLGTDPVWKAELKKNGRVQILEQLSFQGKALGLFEVTVYDDKWKRVNFDDPDIEFIEKHTPYIEARYEMVVSIAGQSTEETKFSHLVNAWIGDAGLEILHAVILQLQTDFPEFPQDELTDDLREMMQFRDFLSGEINTQLTKARAKKKLADKPTPALDVRIVLLEKHAERLKDKVISLRLELSGILVEARMTLANEGDITATLSKRVPRKAASVRALRNEPVFLADGVGDDEPVRLVSLNSWTFYNKGEERGFTRELLDLNAKEKQLLDRNEATIYYETGGNFHVKIPIIPDDTNAADAALMAAGQAYLQAGSVGLPHATRNGEKTLSWYRGPFVPTAFKPPTLPLPARGPDEMLVYDAELGMFDVSYAAAWEIGRLSTLKDNDFAMTLFQWKRDHARTLAHLRQKFDHDYLPLIQQTGPSAPPKKLMDGFDRLTRLEPVPFNYLVPDEDMLPVDSIRFFDVDPLWLEALRDGAFSVGRVLAKDHLDDIAMKERLTPPAMLSGMLMRSSVVRDWPNLRINGYTSIDRDLVNMSKHPNYEPDTLTLERFVPLGEDVMLCLFSDPKRLHRSIEMVDIHLPAEVLHSGLEASANDKKSPPPRTKRLHNPQNGLPLHAYVSMGSAGVPDGMASVYQIEASSKRMFRLMGISDPDCIALMTLRNQCFDTIEDLAKAIKELNLSSPNIASYLTPFFCPKTAKEQVIEDIKFRDAGVDTVLDVTRLMDEIASRTSGVYERDHRFSGADFALQMLDLPPLVRFVRPEQEDSEASQ